MYKQPPIWIINSTLSLFFICMLIIILTMRTKLPSRAPLTSSYVPEAASKDASKIDISQIYRNDLFNTYKENAAPETPVTEKKLQLPPPPTPRPAVRVERRPVQLLEPLAITLKGIMYSSDENYNRVIIQDNKSGAEKLYKVGDSIEDAEIVRIYYNKVMLIRSNGQQETLFVSPADAQKDPLYKHEIVWQNIIQQKSPTEFMIDKTGFTSAIKNLAEFIDMLDITTAFKKGKTVGCRIGVLKPQSVGFALGLQPNDIITAINGIPTTSTNDRVEIFSRVSALTEDESVSVTLLRQGQEMTYTYRLMPIVPEAEPQQASPELPEELRAMHEMSNKLVAEAHAHKNPMIDTMHKNSVSAMVTATKPSSSSLLQQVPT